MPEQKRKIYYVTKTTVHLYREILNSLLESKLCIRNGDSCLFYFIMLYAHASIGGSGIGQGCVHMSVQALRKMFRADTREKLTGILERMRRQELILRYAYSKERGRHGRTFVDIQLNERYTHFVNQRGIGVKKSGYVLLTMDAIDSIISMASKVTEMDAYLDLILHAVVRDKMVEFSEFPVVCFPDSGFHIYPVPRPGNGRDMYDGTPAMCCYEPCVRMKYLVERWKVKKNTVSVRINKFISAGLLTRVTFFTHVSGQMTFLFVPDALITGDKSSMEAIGNIDEDFIWYEAEQHMEDDDYACGEHKVIEGTLRIMTKENPRGEKKSDMDVVPVSAHCETIQSGEDAKEERFETISAVHDAILAEQKEDTRIEPLEHYHNQAVIISISSRDKIQKLVMDLLLARRKEKRYRKPRNQADDRGGG